jgi:hypothetical protein
MDKTDCCEAGDFFFIAQGEFFHQHAEFSSASTVNHHPTKNKNQPNP